MDYQKDAKDEFYENKEIFEFFFICRYDVDNCTCLGGAIVNGMLLDIGTKKYTSPYITVYWDDSF